MKYLRSKIFILANVTVGSIFCMDYNEKTEKYTLNTSKNEININDITQDRSIINCLNKSMLNNLDMSFEYTNKLKNNDVSNTNTSILKNLDMSYEYTNKLKNNDISNTNTSILKNTDIFNPNTNKLINTGIANDESKLNEAFILDDDKSIMNKINQFGMDISQSRKFDANIGDKSKNNESSNNYDITSCSTDSLYKNAQVFIRVEYKEGLYSGNHVDVEEIQYPEKGKDYDFVSDIPGNDGFRTLKLFKHRDNPNKDFNIKKFNNLFKHARNIIFERVDCGFDCKESVKLSPLFEGCIYVESICFRNFFIKNPIDMSFIFYGLEKLEKIDIYGCFKYNIISSLKSAFEGCSNLISRKGSYLNLTGLNTSQVTSMKNMFNGCKKLESIIGLKYWNTSNVENISGMFSGCSSLDSVDISKWNTSNVTDMNSLFMNCNKLRLVTFEGYKEYFSLDTDNKLTFDTKKVKNMSNMFRGCKIITLLDLKFSSTENVTDMSYMFCDCRSIHSFFFDLLGFITINVKNMSHMFENCVALTKLNLNNFIVPKLEDCSSMFAGCTGLEELNIENLFNYGIKRSNTKKVIDKSKDKINDKKNNKYKNKIKQKDEEKIKIHEEKINDLLKDMFKCKRYCLYYPDEKEFKCEEVSSDFFKYFSEINTLINMECMFMDCGLKNLSLPKKVYTYKVKSMAKMFCGCKNLKELDLSFLITDNVENMQSMFENCSELSTIKFGPRTLYEVRGRSDGIISFNTSKVSNMSCMFRCCKELSLDCIWFNVDNVKDMSSMFYYCLKIGPEFVFDVRNVSDKLENVSSMFAYCDNLVSFYTRCNFEGRKSEYGDIFYGCRYLKTIDGEDIKKIIINK